MKFMRRYETDVTISYYLMQSYRARLSRSTENNRHCAWIFYATDKLWVTIQAMASVSRAMHHISRYLMSSSVTLIVVIKTPVVLEEYVNERSLAMLGARSCFSASHTSLMLSIISKISMHHAAIDHRIIHTN